MNENQEKDFELKQFTASYPEVILENEIDRLHFQDSDEKQAQGSCYMTSSKLLKLRLA